MRTIEPIDYVRLACSKDKTRENLTRVYRDTDKLVATDGHRLHWSNGLKESTPGYVDGWDGEFPDYKQVMLKNSKETIATWSAGDAEKLVPFLEYITKIDRKCGCVELDNYTGKLSIVHVADDSKVELRTNLDWPVFRLGVKAKYLLDAIKGLISLDLYSEPINIYSEEKNPLAPIELERGPAHAIIMPMRLK